MLIICLFFLPQPEPVYAYKRYAYKKNMYFRFRKKYLVCQLRNLRFRKISIVEYSPLRTLQIYLLMFLDILVYPNILLNHHLHVF